MNTRTAIFAGRLFLPLLLAFGLTAGLAQADESGTMESNTMYVQSKMAKLYQAPDFKSPVITGLSQGDEVTVQKQEKRWFQINTGTHTGWVSGLVLAKHPPVKKVTVLDDGDAHDEEQMQKARRRASSNNSAAATRGLRESNRTRMNQEDQPDYNALDQVKSQAVSEEAASAFMEKGAQ